MRSFQYIVLFLLLSIIAVPAFLVSGFYRQPQPAGRPRVRLYRHDTGQLVHLDLEEYLIGVVAAEMPARFNMEALKAQAVAARTYALRAIEASGPAHGPHLSSDFRTDQAWASREALQRKWGNAGFYMYWHRIAQAVAATEGEVLTYQGELIFPAYHSTSGGRTENSENYWSSPLPYLRSVPSPYEEHSPHYRSYQELTWADMAKALGIKDGPLPKIEVISRYPGGRVRRVAVGNYSFTGREIREKLGLRSNWFDIAVVDGIIRFNLRGNGHGVGMSQYGADGMARLGYNYREILSHYYRGARLERAY
ncbi:MAG: stage II sporulation protein D [Limnochordia bacterium]|jgi:stage II sporulation protein D